MCTGWQRPIGCLKLQVILCKRVTDYRALLRKITYKDKAFYDPTPRCNMFIISHTLPNLIVPDKIKIDMQHFAVGFVSPKTNTFDLWVLSKFAQFFAPVCKIM